MSIHRKVDTTLHSMLILISVIALRILRDFEILEQDPSLMVTMLSATYAYVLVSTLLILKKRYAQSISLGIVVGCILCGCLLYSLSFWDILVFVVCSVSVLCREYYSKYPDKL